MHQGSDEMLAGFLKQLAEALESPVKQARELFQCLHFLDELVPCSQQQYQPAMSRSQEAVVAARGWYSG